MSSLLEQAIVDAAALKEAALKNARESLFEANAEEIKKAVKTILEAEEDPLMSSPDAPPAPAAPAAGQPAPADSAAAGAVPPPNPAAGADPTVGMAPPADSGADGNDTLLTSPDQEMTAGSEEKADKAFNDVPFSWMAKPNEKVKIDFTSLEEALKLEIRKKTEEDMLIDPKDVKKQQAQKGKAPTLEEEEELELDEDLVSELSSDPMDAGGAVEELEEQEEELEEGTYDFQSGDSSALVAEEELDEVLVVDMEESPQGYMGYNPEHHKEQENIRKALEAAKETEKKDKKKVKELQEALEELTVSYIEIKEKFKNSSDRASKLSENNKKLTESLKNMVISNAKLLYTNKVLTNHSLNERQKQSLVETISNTNNVEKIKAIFETLQSGTQSARRAPESLSEAINKGSSPFLTRRNPQPLVENAQVERFQILAGIKKHN